MLINFFLIVSLSFFIFQTTVESIPTYDCQRYSEYCEFEDIILSLTDYEWEVDDWDINGVTHVKFENCQITVVTNNVCNAFKKLEYYALNEQKVQIVLEDAFHACERLIELYLCQNQIKKIHPNTFLNNKHLKILYLFENEISEIGKVFDKLTDLRYLTLGINNLTEISADVVKHNKDLNTFLLYSNELSDVPVENIVKKLPLLRNFDFSYNELSCVRVVEIVKILKKRGIIFFSEYLNNKSRYYTQKKVFENQHCNTDIEWMASKYRKEYFVLDQSLTEVRDQQNELNRHLQKNDEKLEDIGQQLLQAINQRF